MNTASLYISTRVDTHGALDYASKVGVLRRTLALWLLAAAQWLLRSRLDVEFTSVRSR